MEMSFMTQEDILELNENLIRKVGIFRKRFKA
jgi:aspartyl-tRNA synthetase